MSGVAWTLPLAPLAPVALMVMGCVVLLMDLIGVTG
jgi:hypothetical protein